MPSTPLKSANWSLKNLPGLTQTDLDRLAEFEITTTFGLLRQAATKPGQMDLAGRSGIQLRYLQKWVALADLARVPTIGCQFAGLVLHAGVATLNQLALMPAGQLHRQILKLQVATFQSSDRCPDAGQIGVWIQQAKLLTQRS